LNSNTSDQECNTEDTDDEDMMPLDLQDNGVFMFKSRTMINTIRKSSILNSALLNLG
jgi:hypothetical protein